MDDPLGDSLTVKVGHLVCEDHILDQQGTPGSCSLQIQFVPDGMATPCGKSIWPLLQTKWRKDYGRSQKEGLCVLTYMNTIITS